MRKGELHNIRYPWYARIYICLYILVPRRRIMLTSCQVTANTTSIVCQAPIRDERPRLVQMTIAFLAITTVVVGLRLYQRLSLRSGLFSDDYLILATQVSIASLGNYFHLSARLTKF